MQNLDSLVEEPSEGGSGLEESPDQSLQHRNQICEKTTTGSQNDVNINIAPNIDAAQSDVMQLNVAPSCTNEFRSTANNDGLEEVVEFERESLHVPAQTTARSDILYTAEKVTDSYKRSVNVASSIGVNLTPTLDKTIKIQPTPALTQGLHDQVQSNTPMPTFTSTPILQRQNSIMADNNVTSSSISLIMNRIEQLDLGIKAIKRDVIRHMESQMNQLKSSVISMMENLDSNCTYAKAVIRSSSTPRIEQPTMDSCYIDEGYEDQSQNGIQRSSSQTRPKTISVADSRENMNLENKCRSNIMTSSQEVPVIPTSRIPVATTQHVPVLSSPQPVPVRVTNRNMPNQQQPLISQTNNSSTSQKKTLLIGDSILKGINYRGLKNGVKICARSGALINDLWDEISVYDMKSFRQIIVCVGGNDCASGVDLHDFEKKYDQLIRIIKSANSDCIVYLSKIVPRGDVDVSAFNASIMRIVDYWALQQVKCIEGSYDLFFNRNGMPSNHYYSVDGTHLSHSGIKRLLDAWNRHVEIVKDFKVCVFQTNQMKRTFRAGVNKHGNYESQSANNYRGQNNRGLRHNGQRRNDYRRCYGCLMPGHILAECWHAQ